MSRAVTLAEGHAIRCFILDKGGYSDRDEQVHVIQWARLRLPNGQISRSRWKEDGMQTENIRMSRNVKVEINGEMHIVEIHFYMVQQIGEIKHALAVGSFYGKPDEELFQRSSKTYYTVQHFCDVDIRVFDVKCIHSAVMMAPDTRHIHKFDGGLTDGTEVNRWFLVQKPGLKIGSMVGYSEPQ